MKHGLNVFVGIRYEVFLWTINVTLFASIRVIAKLLLPHPSINEIYFASFRVIGKLVLQHSSINITILDFNRVIPELLL